VVSRVNGVEEKRVRLPAGNDYLDIAGDAVKCAGCENNAILFLVRFIRAAVTVVVRSVGAAFRHGGGIRASCKSGNNISILPAV